MRAAAAFRLAISACTALVGRPSSSASTRRCSAAVMRAPRAAASTASGVVFKVRATLSPPASDRSGGGYAAPRPRLCTRPGPRRRGVGAEAVSLKFRNFRHGDAACRAGLQRLPHDLLVPLPELAAPLLGRGGGGRLRLRGPQSAGLAQELLGRRRLHRGGGLRLRHGRGL